MRNDKGGLPNCGWHSYGNGELLILGFMLTLKENQRVEWKDSWRDEYLRWICGFANAESGMLVIGRDDNGNIAGVSNTRKLLEDLPNKIRDVLLPWHER